MLYVFLSIFCSVVVSVLFKLARRYQIDVLQAITWNFTAAILLIGFIYKPSINQQILSSVPIYSYIGLGILLPILFLLISASIRINGIVLTTIVDRLSLFIPLIISYLIFHSELDNIKLIALALCFIAIVCIVPWKRTSKRSAGGWMYLLALFIGMGVSLLLFRQLATYAIPNTSSLFIVFIVSFITSIVFLIVNISRKKTQFSWPHILIGWIMGLAFFGFIIFNMQIHKAMATQPRAAFSALNVGVITLAMMIGLFIFNERLTKLNKLGIFLALVAIIVVANTDLVNAF